MPEDEAWPGEMLSEQRAVPGDLVIEGPTDVEPGYEYTWTVSGPGVDPGDRIDFGWGGDTTGGPCPRRALGVCVDITNPARRMEIGYADASGVAVFTRIAPGTPRNQVFLQALKMDGPDSDKSDPYPVNINHGPPPGPGEAVNDVMVGGSPPWIVDANRIVVTPDTVYVAILSSLHSFTHALGNEQVVLSRVEPGSNMGMTYDAVRNRVVTYEVGDPDVGLAVYNDDFSSLLIDVVDTGATTGSGDVTADGHLHVPLRTGTGIYEYDLNLNLVGVWGTSSSGRDIAVDGNNVLWHLSFNRMQGYDMNDPARPMVADVTIDAGADALEIDDYGVHYVGYRNAEVIRAYMPDGTLLDTIVAPPGEEPAALTYNPHNEMLVAGYYISGQSALRNHLRVPPIP